MSTKVSPPDNDVLWTRELSFTHDGSPALSGLSLGVRAGEILAVTGPRGAGKTTLLRCLAGQLPPQSGEIWFNSVPLHTLSRGERDRVRRDRFGWVGSTPELVPELTAWENVALPLLLAGVGRRSARRGAQEWLERLDVGACATYRPAALLRPQRQRVAIARAFVHEPAVLFADEPTAVLHHQDRVNALRTLTAAARSHGVTVLLATHEPAALPRTAGPEHAGARMRPPSGRPGAGEPSLADRTLTLVDGRRTAHRPGPSPERAAPAERAHGQRVPEPARAQPSHDAREARPCSLSV